MTRMNTKVVRDDILLKDEVYAIIGAAIEVHNRLRSGFVEAIYQEALQIELGLRGIPFEPQKELRVVYKGHLLEKKFFADVVCYGQIIVEIKAQRELAGYEEMQIINYLRATGLRVGVLINFGDPGRLDWHRFVV